MEDLFSAQLTEQALRQFQHLVAATFRQAVERERIVASKELHDSIQVGSLTYGQARVEASIYFNYLLRIKDMKILSFHTLPPINAMRRFVEQHGVGRFAYVPGYASGKQPVDSVAVDRIASAVTFHFKSTPTVKRGYRGIYNEEKMQLVTLFAEELRQYAATYVQEALRAELGNPTVVLPITQNAARKVAAQRAYADGKIDTSKLALNFNR